MIQRLEEQNASLEARLYELMREGTAAIVASPDAEERREEPSELQTAALGSRESSAQVASRSICTFLYINVAYRMQH
jgi:hypothetical protein